MTEMTGVPAVRVSNMTKLYKNGRGVKNIDLTLEPGDIVGLLGPNGSGKTTIMKVIVGLCHATDGTAEVFGHSIERDYEAAAKHIGALIESPALYYNLSAEKNLRLAARVRGASSEDIARVLALVRLDRYARDKVARFSLGMKQRLGLALALLGSPDLLVLDEPTNGLDIEGTVEVRELILRLAAERGHAFLIASHLASEIERTCNKVAIIHEGELLSFVSVTEAVRRAPTLEDYFLAEVRQKRGGAVI